MSREWTFRAPPAQSTVEASATAPEPSFSVVIAAHDAGRTIREAVESALEQTRPALEVIVCNDGSTDDTASLLATYRRRIVVVDRAHGGVAAARNAALERASGDFFAVLDADDVYLPERLEALTALTRARPDLDILATDLQLEIEGEPVATFTEGCPFEVVDQRAAILERCFCAAPAVRRTSLLELGGYDETLQTGSDWECAIRLIHCGAVAGLVDAPLYRYRIQPESLTADRVNALGERVRFLARIAGSRTLGHAERHALARSLKRQQSALALAEAERALRARAPDSRARALAAARSSDVSLATRAGALAAAVMPRAAARVLERRARRGDSRLVRPIERR